MSNPKPLPEKRPCSSCPYRRDVPQGVWHADEYAKLTRYDEETGDQPTGLFYCHQRDGRLCAGWVGCHDMEDTLAVRIGVVMGALTPEQAETLVDYTSEVPLHPSGREAALHGMAGIEDPDPLARRAIEKLKRQGRTG